MGLAWLGETWQAATWALLGAPCPVRPLPKRGAGSTTTTPETIATCQSPRYRGGGRHFVGRGVTFSVQGVTPQVSHRGRCNRYASCSKCVLLLLLLLAVCRCVVADSRKGNTYWTDDVAQRAGERNK